MNTNRYIPAPQRLADQAGTAASAVAQAAATLEPPTGTQERIWRRLAAPNLRLVELEGESPSVLGVLRDVAQFEPPPGARERIWRALSEAHAVREGLAEPKRLLDTDDAVAGLLARAAVEEPTPGRQARVYRRMQRPEKTRVRWALPVGVLAAATAMLLVVSHFRTSSTVAPATVSLALTLPQSADLKVTHAQAVAGSALAVGDQLTVGSSGEARFQVKGIGDAILSQPGASLKLLQADSHGVHLELADGRISLHAEKRTRSAPLVIHAQGTEVEVVGTIFTVETTPSGPHVYVREGLVEVRSKVRIGASQSWPPAPEAMPDWAANAMATLAGEQPASAPIPPPAVVGAPAKKVIYIEPIRKTHVGSGKTGPMIIPLPAPPESETVPDIRTHRTF